MRFCISRSHLISGLLLRHSRYPGGQIAEIEQSLCRQSLYATAELPEPNLKIMSRRKIAFIHPDLGIGGAERLILDVASALSKQENEIIFLTNHFDKNHAFEELKSGTFPVQVFGDWLPRSIFVYVFFCRREEKPDIYFVDLIPTAIPFLKFVNEKVIYYCHHPDLLSSTPGNALKRFYRKPIDWFEMKSTAQADVILVNSKYTASVFRETFPDITKPIQVVYPTVAYSYVETVKKIKIPRRIEQVVPDIPANPLCVFLSINRFHPAKRLEMAILALDNLKKKTTSDQWRRIFLIMAGGYDPQSHINASYFEELQQLVKKKELTEKIIFLKSPSDVLKAELLLSCDCVIYTPINEHFGIVPLEAMTVSKPVIACNSGGPRETVDHGKTGYLCEATPESMAEFMYRILDKSTAKEMGSNGNKVLQENFSLKTFSNTLRNIVNFEKKSN